MTDGADAAPANDVTICPLNVDAVPENATAFVGVVVPPLA